MEPKPTYTTNGRLTGQVKWFSNAKGYGFIIPDDDSQEVFVHYSAIDADGYRSLYEGDRVTFDLVDKGRGPQAQNVRASSRHWPSSGNTSSKWRSCRQKRKWRSSRQNGREWSQTGQKVTGNWPNCPQISAYLMTGKKY